MSKRRNYPNAIKNVIQFIKEYQDMGYLPEAMFNFISLLGWSPQGNEEILSKEEIISQFDPSRLSKAPAMFDKNKLAYINSRYIKKLSVDELSLKSRPYLEKSWYCYTFRRLVKTFSGYITRSIKLYW